MSDRRHIVILGGTSDIGKAVAHCFARDGYDVTLAARNCDRLEADRSDIALRHNVTVRTTEFDVLDSAAMAPFVDSFTDCPDVVVSVVGTMGDHAESIRSPDAAALVIRTNFECPSLILGVFATRMEQEDKGTLVGVSSVAGDRGRGSNYVYGAAKAGFTAYLSGLRNRLSRTNVHVVTVKPGFVATRMTADLDLPGPLTAKPSEVGEAVLRAVQKRHNVVYVRGIWRIIMLIIRAMPEALFKKTDL